MKIKVLQKNILIGYMKVTKENERVASSVVTHLKDCTINYTPEELIEFQRSKTHTFVGEL